jgi:hypothetical protein
VCLNSVTFLLYLSFTASISIYFTSSSARKTEIYASQSRSNPAINSLSKEGLARNRSSSLTSQSSFFHRNTNSVIGPIFPPPFIPATTSSTHSLYTTLADSSASWGWCSAISAWASWKWAFRDTEGGGESEIAYWERVITSGKWWSFSKARRAVGEEEGVG